MELAAQFGEGLQGQIADTFHAMRSFCGGVL
jgi:hypothetical protein